MKSAHCVAAAAVVLAATSFQQRVDEPPVGTGGIVTLWHDDPLAHDFSFRHGRYGGIFEDHVRKNRGMDLDFAQYTPGEFTVALEGGRTGSILDLGAIDDLQRRHGWEETVGGGQGFASIRRAGDRFVILRDYERQTTQPLPEARHLASAKNHAPIADGHVYLARIADQDGSDEVLVKLLVLAYAEKESVTLRWELVD
jgi:hypothetical protein